MAEEENKFIYVIHPWKRDPLTPEIFLDLETALARYELVSTKAELVPRMSFQELRDCQYRRMTLSLNKENSLMLHFWECSFELREKLYPGQNVYIVQQSFGRIADIPEVFISKEDAIKKFYNLRAMLVPEENYPELEIDPRKKLENKEQMGYAGDVFGVFTEVWMWSVDIRFSNTKK
jgi:hypothetical protein